MVMLQTWVGVSMMHKEGLKSHVFMECLLSIAFRELLDHVWKPLTELSEYFRDLCSSTLRVDDLLVME